jgi:hypothetical protein
MLALRGVNDILKDKIFMILFCYYEAKISHEQASHFRKLMLVSLLYKTNIILKIGPWSVFYQTVLFYLEKYSSRTGNYGFPLIAQHTPGI